jgi:hypothetical protein
LVPVSPYPRGNGELEPIGAKEVEGDENVIKRTSVDSKRAVVSLGAWRLCPSFHVDRADKQTVTNIVENVIRNLRSIDGRLYNDARHVCWWQ